MNERPAEPAPIQPEDRDWTYVITDGCAECGFRPTAPAATGPLLRATIPAWRATLSRPDAAVRPAPTVWSPLEYGCHVRDTCALFRQRLNLMLDEDDPTFANWDQDAAAIEGDYFHADPATVLADLEREAAAIADAFDGVRATSGSVPDAAATARSSRSRRSRCTSCTTSSITSTTLPADALA